MRWLDGIMNSMDIVWAMVNREAWSATVHGVTKSHIQLSNWIATILSTCSESIHLNLIFKILQARLQQYVNCELPDVQAGFRKGRGIRDQIVNICWIMEKAREFQRKIYFCFTDYAKAFAVWTTTNSGKFFKRWEYQTTWPAFWEICIQVRKHELELDMEQQTGSKQEKEYVKAVYCHPAYLTYMQSTSW